MNPNEPIFCSMSYGIEYKRVVFVLAGLGMRPSWFRRIARNLQRAEYRVIVYTYCKTALSPDIKQTVENFFVVKEAILQHIEELKQEGCTEISLFGSSLGTVLALAVANEGEGIAKIILNLTSLDMIEALWHWGDGFHPEFKQAFQKYSI